MKGVIAAFAAFACAMPLFAGAQVVISEVMYDPPGSDTGKEWFEIYNAGTSYFDISKWKVNDGSNHSLNLPPKNGSIGSPIVAPQSFIIIAADAAAFRASHPNVSGSIIDTTMSLSNTNGTISLLDASGTVMESIQYSSALGASGTGDSLQRMNLAQGASFAGGPATPNASPPSGGLFETSLPQKVSKQTTKKVPIPHASAKKAKEIPITSDSVDPVPQDQAISAPEISTGAQTASAGVSFFGNPLWWIAALTIAALVGFTILGANHFRKDEWDIVEESGE